MIKELQEMSLADYKNYCSSALKEELKSCLGDACEVRIKNIENKFNRLYDKVKKMKNH